MSDSFGLSVYPLSSAYRAGLISHGVAPDRFVAVSQLRTEGIGRSVRTLRALWRQRCFVIFETESSEVLRPIIATIALTTFPRSIILVHHNYQSSPFSFRDGFRSAGALLSGSFRGAVAVRRARNELARLMRLSRADRPARLDRARVLYLNANLYYGVTVGGSVGHVAGVVNALDAAGLRVDLATAPDPIMIRPSVRVIPLRPESSLGLPLEFNYYSFQQEVVSRLRHVSPEAYSFVYQRLSIGNYAGVVLARSLAIPLVLEYNGSEVWAARNWGRPLRREAEASLAEDVSFRHASLIVTVSEPLVRELIGRGVEPDRIVCYPNGVDPGVFDPEMYSAAARRQLRARYGIPPEAIVATFIGTFGLWHGVDVLARVARAMAHSEAEWVRRTGLRFLFVGDGRMMADVRELLKGLGDLAIVAGRVPQDQAPIHLAASDILVSPHVQNVDGSEFFGSPTKLFEYMAMGKGIAASRLGQIDKVLTPALAVDSLPEGPTPDDEARVAILVRPGDEDDLGRALRFLVERPDWRVRLGANARERALSRFTWSHHVKAILSGVQRIAGP